MTPVNRHLKNNKILLALMPFWNPLLPPQGICYIKGFLKQHGYEVQIFDFNLDGRLRKIIDKYLNALKSYLKPDRIGNFYNIGNDVLRDNMMAHIHQNDENRYLELIQIIVYQTFFQQISQSQARELKTILDEFFGHLHIQLLQLLRKESPGLLGLSVYRDTLPASLYAFRLTRQYAPEIVTFMGGSVFTIQLTLGSPNFELFLAKTEGYIDKIVIGNGAKMLLKYLRGELPGRERVYTSAHLGDDAFDFPEMSLFDYSDFDPTIYNISAAQGSISCPNRCSFCNVAAFYGSHRVKPPRQTVAEMIAIYQKNKHQLFHMMDALMNPIATEMSEEFLSREEVLYWDGYLRVEDELDLDKAVLWRRGGYYRARIGIESGSQKVLDLMNKKITVEQTKKNIANLAAAGIKTTVYVVIGHPGESENDFQQTLNLMSDLKNDIYEAECNPFTYFYSGQGKSGEWEERRVLLYPDWATDWLLTQTWIVKGDPSRAEMFERIFRFVNHCRTLGILLPWSFFNVNKSDQRWKQLHKNAVPSLFDLMNRDRYLTECKTIKKLDRVFSGYEDSSTFQF